jgi:MerR family transcriptional regulator, mercuric resistance operon regulatory protein
MARGVQIGKVAQQTGLSVDTIRYYEKERLLREPPRSEGGYRLYSERDIEHLLFIRKAQELGFSLAEIRELLIVQDERTGACTHVHELIEQRLRTVRQKIADLKRLESHLEEAEAKCAQALREDSADPHHECCPVLTEIVQSAPYQGGGHSEG